MIIFCINIISVEFCIENIVLQNHTVQNASTVSPVSVVQNVNNIPSVLFTVQNTSTVSPLPVIQYRNEIPSVLVQSTVGDKLLMPDK